MSKERIGVMGGTFNPIHEGHLAMARAAMVSAKLDRVLFLPDSVPPHKTGIAPAEDRWRMTVAAVAGLIALAVAGILTFVIYQHWEALKGA